MPSASIPAISFADVATAATIGSSVVSGLGAIQQSQASAASAGYNAKIAAQNAQIQTQNAQFAGAQGEQEVAAQEMKNKARMGATLAAQGASGVDVNTGSDVNVRESEAKLGQLDALTIRSNAAKQAYGYQLNAMSATEQSNLYRSQQSADKAAGYITAGADVLGGVGKAYSFMTPQAASYMNSSSVLPSGVPAGLQNFSPDQPYTPLPWQGT